MTLFRKADAKLPKARLPRMPKMPGVRKVSLDWWDKVEIAASNKYAPKWRRRRARALVSLGFLVMACLVYLVTAVLAAAWIVLGLPISLALQIKPIRETWEDSWKE